MCYCLQGRKAAEVKKKRTLSRTVAVLVLENTFVTRLQPNWTLCFALLNLLCVNQSSGLTVQSWKLSVHAFFEFLTLLHARPSCVWADNGSACSRISHQPQLAQTLWGGFGLYLCASLPVAYL